MELSFLGAATTVTGSQYLLQTGSARVLVDCGMFQGSPHETLRNRVPFAFDVGSLDAVLLTHAHLDHCGLLPYLVASGFRGPIYATAGTVELAGLVLLDAAKLQTEFARRAVRRGPRGARPPLDPETEIRAQKPEVVVEIDEPLYDEADALAAIRAFRPVRYGDTVAVAPGVSARFVDAGHILGSAMVELRADERTIVFSGDIGRPNTPIIRDPTMLHDADYVLLESTYGGRTHEPLVEAAALLGETVRAVGEAGGVLLIPAFAIGRTQELVWELDRLVRAGTIPRLPLYLDSPMAAKATDIYRRHEEYFDDETRAILARERDAFDYPGAIVTNDAARSRAIRAARRPYLIVASNGMLTGGRVLAHLDDLVDDSNATLLFVGYQGEGTLGAHLQARVKTIRINGAEREVRCRVRSISGFSAHADEGELLAWLGNFAAGKRPGDPGFPRRVFVVHGDPPARRAIAPKISALGFATTLPGWRDRVRLD